MATHEIVQDSKHDEKSLSVHEPVSTLRMRNVHANDLKDTTGVREVHNGEPMLTASRPKH